ncbi:hypothetical protein C1637_12455 [Chryseobacterium lactis]|uniref:Uncharacterized protein n=1 Tax=Chryseobacterium lactis TaxID=1241981 RepID=A0A3G6RN23_CHRLC|nr:hypothetical protein [Chryseobacterium lactis]AZA80666.1 hypothetical protein EG342_01485 [Chryseobacterium lactis]AZB05668.1 hypothetical protein EG341_17610 [Chryseobacterium lactis]PNW13613.1 hypothetical protein C1637_12455 [Chryseobacterium lactis]
MKQAVLFFMLVSGLSFSQQKNLKISDLQPKTKDFVFPVISYSDNSRIEKKINLFLQVSELEYIPGSEGNPSKKVNAGATSYANYVYFYDWKKLETPKNILSISIDGEASGAYPEEFSDWKNFDLRTGNYINAEDLFQEGAVKTINGLIQKKIKKRVDNFLVKLKSQKNASEEVQEQIGLYEGCFIDYTLNGIRYFFGKDKLTFVAGRCSNHAMRALDDLGSHEIEFSYKELEKYWSPYAKNLISGSEKTDRTSPGNKLYKGKIDGKYPITVLFNEINEDDSFSATYWYDKNKKQINWRGEFVHGHFSITEDDYHSEELKQWIPRALVEADLKGNKIIGTWQDAKTKKYLTLELEEL